MRGGYWVILSDTKKFFGACLCACVIGSSVSVVFAQSQLPRPLPARPEQAQLPATPSQTLQQRILEKQKEIEAKQAELVALQKKLQAYEQTTEKEQERRQMVATYLSPYQRFGPLSMKSPNPQQASVAYITKMDELSVDNKKQITMIAEDVAARFNISSRTKLKFDAENADIFVQSCIDQNFKNSTSCSGHLMGIQLKNPISNIDYVAFPVFKKTPKGIPTDKIDYYIVKMITEVDENGIPKDLYPKPPAGSIKAPIPKPLPDNPNNPIRPPNPFAPSAPGAPAPIRNSR